MFRLLGSPLWINNAVRTACNPHQRILKLQECFYPQHEPQKIYFRGLWGVLVCGVLNSASFTHVYARCRPHRKREIHGAKTQAMHRDPSRTVFQTNTRFQKKHVRSRKRWPEYATKERYGVDNALDPWRIFCACKTFFDGSMERTYNLHTPTSMRVGPTGYPRGLHRPVRFS